MDDIPIDKPTTRSRSARKAARTKAVKVFDDKIKELEKLVEDVKADAVGPTKANTLVRIYSCMLEWTKGKRQVYLEEVLAADVRNLREELRGGRKPEDAS